MRTPEQDRLPMPAVITDKAMLRTLLLSLGLKVSITWTPSGKRFFKVHRVEISADTTREMTVHKDGRIARINTSAAKNASR